MIERLTDAEQFKASVERIPEYVSENSTRELFYEILGESFQDLAIYTNTESVEEGHLMEYEGTDIVMPELKSCRELQNTDIIQGYLQNYDLNTGDTVIDAGAYPGETTVYFAKQVGETGDVIALEPDEDNMRRLQDAVRVNNLQNVSLIPKGLYSHQGVVGFSESHLLGSSIEENGDSQIQVTTLDQLINNLDIEPDFVKMDIEGAEIEALEGASTVMHECTPDFAVASYHKVNGSQSAGRIEEILEENGYRADTGFEDHQTTWGTK